MEPNRTIEIEDCYLGQGDLGAVWLNNPDSIQMKNKKDIWKSLKFETNTLVVTYEFSLKSRISDHFESRLYLHSLKQCSRLASSAVLRKRTVKKFVRVFRQRATYLFDVKHIVCFAELGFVAELD
jgi:hypothetical protein